MNRLRFVMVCVLFFCLLQSSDVRAAYAWTSNPAETTLEASDRNTFDELGLEKVTISDDKQHIISCGYKWGGGTDYGQCWVWSESYPGARDWATEHTLQPPGQGTTDYLGFSGPIISTDNRHIVACAQGYNSFTGACYVFTETSVGSMDWGDTNLTRLEPSNGVAQDRFGDNLPSISADGNAIGICVTRWFNSDSGLCYLYGSINDDWSTSTEVIVQATIPASSDYFGDDPGVFSADGQLFLACAHTYASSAGTCFIFSATGPGTHDWALSHTLFSNSGEQEQFGSWPLFSSSLRHVVVGAPSYSGADFDVGCIYVFTESMLGAKDWDSEVPVRLTGSASANSASLSRYGQGISPDEQHIYACAYEQSFCYIFSQSAPGRHDWDKNETVIARNGFTNFHSWSTRNQLMVCNPNNERCWIYSESSNGTRDWASNVVQLSGANGDFGKRGSTLSKDGQVAVACASQTDTRTGSCFAFTDFCHSITCLNDGVCSNRATNYSCACTAASGKTGALCGQEIDECVTMGGCQHQGICIDGKANFTCDCSATDYNGTVCENQIDECTSSPCAMGTCSDDGSAPNAFNCTCDSGYTGPLCDVNIDDCVSDPCLHNGTCTDVVSLPNDFDCNCTLGYEGAICAEDVNDCLALPQICNNGTCSDDGSVPNEFNCTCDVGFTGTLCNVDVDDCAAVNPCFNNGTCSDDGSIANSFNCSCESGWQGILCDADVDDCMSSPCAIGFSCLDTGLNSYQCPTPCDSSPCLNDGLCVAIDPATITCVCTSASGGAYCEILLDPFDVQIVIFDLPKTYFSVHITNLSNAIVEEILEDIPEAIKEQFNVSWVETTESYTVTIIVYGSVDVTTAVIVQSIDTNSDRTWGFNIDEPVDVEDTEDPNGNNISFTLLVIIFGSIVLIICFLIWYCRFRQRQNMKVANIRDELTNQASLDNQQH